MEKKKDILDSLTKARRPLLPDNFYEEFWTNLMLRIENESGILGQLKKVEKPAVPEDFFQKLTNLVPEEEDSTPLDRLQKSKLPSVPPRYFEQAADRIMGEIEKEEDKNTSRGSIINMRFVTVVSAIAAAVIIIFTVINLSGDGDNRNIAEVDLPDENNSEQVLTADNYEDYLAYLDEDEIIDYIIENDIEIEDTTDAVEYEDYFDFSEEDIEDYYLDLL